MLIVLVLLLAYLIGSIPSGLWIGKIFYGIDIREHGSGNLGGTNTFRTLGKKAGFAVTIMDVLKGTLATLLPVFFGIDAELHPLITGTTAVVGHMFPIFAGFKGGKAVATSGGILLGYAPILFLIIFVVFFISLYICKYVSLSSMICAVAALIVTIIMRDIPLIIVVAVLTTFILYRHRANIKRIKDGTEPKVKWI
ncbi:glycerol-3-phosphate 1-O-acyltransferase PlsY [Bacillus sp. AGMB 02131]|uniref:Glycerol-3-phosphate acyltransferase n=1 Tax=Peribacillus faecalis TaxID=2772559 RepID=A0A927CT10_9BACI|nr:glycerol-3-phosphate 1-O-acyltransferase PlsY [Peribacillus faecalis]MBD3107327.1 glycerol-3-phosphate 1-O-acyltransferase PlsY [Peribacillus faecalis]